MGSGSSSGYLRFLGRARKAFPGVGISRGSGGGGSGGLMGCRAAILVVRDDPPGFEGEDAPLCDFLLQFLLF